MIRYPIPLLGFSAWSGTGKTTLLRRLLPLLKAQGLTLGVIKHAHHSFEIDLPGKDRYELRSAGADQVLVVSRRRMALIRELPERTQEPTLEEVLAELDPGGLDLLLVEGYKHAAFPKIELHRQALGKPLLYPRDPHIVAVASDRPLETELPTLDLNQPSQVADFVIWLVAQHRKSGHAEPQHPHRTQLR